MIILDIETSSGNPVEGGIWQIGALEFENPENQFLQEARIDDEDIATEESMKIIGKTEEELRDKKKQSQKELIENFLKWFNSVKHRDLLCHNPQFDHSFIAYKKIKYSKEDPFWPDYHKAFDLHTIAQIKFFELNGKFLTRDNHSDMGLGSILKFCGVEYSRRSVKDNKISREGKPHNALEDCKLEAECFSRLLYGKNLFPEFAKFEIPEALKNGA